MVVPILWLFLALFVESSIQGVVYDDNFAEDYILRTNDEDQGFPDIFRLIRSNNKENGNIQNRKTRGKKGQGNYYTIDKLDVYLRNDESDAGNQPVDRFLKDYYDFEELRTIKPHHDLDNVDFGVKDDNVENIGVQFVAIEKSDFYLEKPVTVTELANFIDSVKRHTDGLFKITVNNTKTLKEMISLVQALPPQVQKQLHFKTDYLAAKSKFGKVTTTFAKNDNSILYGPKGPVNIKPYDDDKGGDILVPKSLYESIIAFRKEENTKAQAISVFSRFIARKRLLPPTRQQRQKLTFSDDDTKEQNSRYKSWFHDDNNPQRRRREETRRSQPKESTLQKKRAERRNAQENYPEQGFRFEMEVDGLGQINA